MSNVGYAEDPTLAQLGDFRIFVQEDGLSPANEFLYHGNLELGGLTEGQGDLTPIYVPSPDQRNRWVIVGYTRAVRGLPTSDFTSRMLKTLQDVWWKFKEMGCPFNAHVLIGTCESPDDFFDWTAKILLDSAVLTDLSLPVMNPLSGENNAPGDITGSLTMLGLGRILPIQFEEQAETTLLAEAVDGIYRGVIQCGSCGAPDDGCNVFLALAVANSGSPGLSSQIIYTTDDKATWGAIDIPTLGGLSGRRMAEMGRYIVVVSAADGAHHVIPYSSLIAGTTADWVRVSTNYVGGGTPRAIYRISSNRAIIGGQGGYLYRLTNPTAAPTIISDGSITTQNINDIAGFGNMIVAVGDNRAILVSANKGDSFALKVPVDADGVAITGHVTAVAVTGLSTWFIGIAGQLYYTVDEGASYVLHPGWPEASTVINRIQFADRNVGYVACEVNGVGAIYRTDSMGNVWSNTNPWIDSVPSALHYNFCVPCGYNEVAIGGIESAATDGVLAIAT